MNATTTLRATAWLFLAFGVAAMTGGGVWAQRTSSFLSRAESAPGTVIALAPHRGERSTLYAPIVRFSTSPGDERRFEHDVRSSPPGYGVGEAVEVLYDPERPHDARIRSFGALWGGPLVVCGLGVVFGGVGAGILLARRLSTRRAADLRLRGRRVVARFQEVERNRSLEVNGRSPWRIVAQWRDPGTGKVHLFHSENLWFDPTPYVDRTDIAVFVDPANPRRHHVDVSFLPEVAA